MKPFFRIIVGYISQFSGVIVGIYAIYIFFNARNLKLVLTKEWKVLTIFFIIRPLFDIWANFVYNIIPSLALVMQPYLRIGAHLYTWVELLVYVYIFTVWQVQGTVTNVLRWSVIVLFFSFSLTMKICEVEPLTEFDSLSVLAENFMVMLLGIFSLSHHVNRSLIPPHENPHFIVNMAVVMGSILYIFVSALYARFPELTIAFPAINTCVNMCFVYALYQLNRYMKRFNKSIGESWHD